jgi:hypothetical protein
MSLTQAVLQTIGGAIDEVTLAGDPDSFVEMDQGVIHIESRQHGMRYLRVDLVEVDKADYP